MHHELIQRMQRMADLMGGNVASLLQDAMKAVKGESDPLDTAYIALGAKHALAELPEEVYSALSDGLGESGLIDEVITACVPLVAEAWDAVGPDGVGGVWVYEVSEELGAWWVYQYIDAAPTEDMIRAQIAKLVEAMG